MTPEKPVGQKALEIRRLREEKRRADAAARTSETQLVNALRMARLGHWVYEVAEDAFQFNDLTYALLRTTAAREGGYTMSSARYAERFLLPEDRAMVAQGIQAALETDDPHYDQQLEHRVIFGDGTMGHIAVHVFVEKDGQGKTVTTHGVNQDITARKQTEEQIARLNRVRRMLSAINTLIVHVQDQQELLQEACRIAVEEGEFPLAWAGLLASGETTLRPQFWAGREDGFLDRVLIPLEADAPGGKSVSSQALRTRKLAVVNYPDEAGHDVPWSEEARARGFRAIAALPIVAEGRPAGVLTLHSETPGFFDAEEMQLLDELGGDISYALQNLRKEKALAYLSSYDSLTGLANGALFYEHLNSVLERARKNTRQVGLLVCDLRQFRNINSVYGRQRGDRILQEAARRLRELSSDPVNIARIASDYFAMILHDVGDATGAAYMLENVFFPCMNQAYIMNGQAILAPCSGGVAIFPADGADAETLYRNAEAALRKAKRLNEPYLYYQPEMTARIAETMQIEHKLRRALKEERFVLHYQPRIAAHGGRIVGVEALIRWNDPENGLVPPGRFIPILEESGLILEVGQWALEQAARDYRHWRRKCKAAPRIAVNVSAIQLRQNNFVAQVEKAIRKGGKPVPMDIEITESLIMTDVEQNIVKLRALQAAGIGIAVDDFGTGYSSLSYVAKLPINALKIDRSFIDDMLTQADGLTIVSTIIALAQSLRLQVVAEGVETEEQARLLQSMRCDEMQGFLFSRPVPADAILALIRGGGQLGIGDRG